MADWIEKRLSHLRQMAAEENESSTDEEKEGEGEMTETCDCELISCVNNDKLHGVKSYCHQYYMKPELIHQYLDNSTFQLA